MYNRELMGDNVDGNDDGDEDYDYDDDPDDYGDYVDTSNYINDPPYSRRPRPANWDNLNVSVMRACLCYPSCCCRCNIHCSFALNQLSIEESSNDRPHCCCASRLVLLLLL